MFRQRQKDARWRLLWITGVPISLPAPGWRDTGIDVRAIGNRPVSCHAAKRCLAPFAEMRHVLQRLFDPHDPVADLPMTLFFPTKTPPDILCLYAARALRGFGDGFAIIILPVYLSAIGFSTELIGIVASASLLGTAALTLVTGFIAQRFELRSLFLAGAGLIAFTGLIFPAAETIAPVLLVAFIGSINPSGGDLGMLVPLEHALLTKETADRDRTAVFARYSLIGRSPLPSDRWRRHCRRYSPLAAGRSSAPSS
jgi:hypothetical protein